MKDYIFGNLSNLPWKFRIDILDASFLASFFLWILWHKSGTQYFQIGLKVDGRRTLAHKIGTEIDLEAKKSLDHWEWTPSREPTVKNTSFSLSPSLRLVRGRVSSSLSSPGRFAPQGENSECRKYARSGSSSVVGFNRFFSPSSFWPGGRKTLWSKSCDFEMDVRCVFPDLQRNLSPRASPQRICPVPNGFRKKLLHTVTAELWLSFVLFPHTDFLRFPVRSARSQCPPQDSMYAALGRWKEKKHFLAGNQAAPNRPRFGPSLRTHEER